MKNVHPLFQMILAPVAPRARLSEADAKYYRDRHHELVMCADCKEWTEFGDSCCGATQCEEECPICSESETV
jgi:hypothetical protein